MFIWCFFLAIAQLAIEKKEGYDWVKYIYIDDPISSLDDNNAIAVAHYLASILKEKANEIKIRISTHHSLFYNVLCNEFNNGRKLFLRKENNSYILEETTDTPFIYHIHVIKEIQKAIDDDKLFTYHFSMLRNLLEKTANFHGFSGFKNLLDIFSEEKKPFHYRYIQVLNHGGHSLFESVYIKGEDKKVFEEIFELLKENYKFNEKLFENKEEENND